MRGVSLFFSLSMTLFGAAKTPPEDDLSCVSNTPPCLTPTLPLSAKMIPFLARTPGPFLLRYTRHDKYSRSGLFHWFVYETPPSGDRSFLIAVPREAPVFSLSIHLDQKDSLALVSYPPTPSDLESATSEKAFSHIGTLSCYNFKVIFLDPRETNFFAELCGLIKNAKDKVSISVGSWIEASKIFMPQSRRDSVLSGSGSRLSRSLDKTGLTLTICESAEEDTQKSDDTRTFGINPEVFPDILNVTSEEDSKLPSIILAQPNNESQEDSVEENGDTFNLLESEPPGQPKSNLMNAPLSKDQLSVLCDQAFRTLSRLNQDVHTKKWIQCNQGVLSFDDLTSVQEFCLFSPSPNDCILDLREVVAAHHPYILAADLILRHQGDDIQTNPFRLYEGINVGILVTDTLLISLVSDQCRENRPENDATPFLEEALEGLLTEFDVWKKNLRANNFAFFIQGSMTGYIYHVIKAKNPLITEMEAIQPPPQEFMPKRPSKASAFEEVSTPEPERSSTTFGGPHRLSNLATPLDIIFGNPSESEEVPKTFI